MAKKKTAPTSRKKKAKTKPRKSRIPQIEIINAEQEEEPPDAALDNDDAPALPLLQSEEPLSVTVSLLTLHE